MQIKNGKPTTISDQGRWLYGERYSMTSHLGMLVTYTFSYRVTGNGLISIPDHDTWKPRRKIYEHSFNKRYSHDSL